MARPYTNDAIDVEQIYDGFYRKTKDVRVAAILCHAEVMRSIALDGHLEMAVRGALKTAVIGDCEDGLDLLCRWTEWQQLQAKNNSTDKS